MKETVIVAAVRTPIGRAGKGSLADVRPDDLLAHAVREGVERSGIDPKEVDDVIAGSAGEANTNVARAAWLLAGYPETVPATTVNRFCASSLQALRIAMHAIRSGEGDLFVVGGVEHSTTLGPRRAMVPDDERVQALTGPHPALTGPDAAWELYLPMGLTAERVAEKYDVSRERMDEYAQASQERAVAAQKDGFFEREIAAYPKPDGTLVDRDDGPRPDSTLERLASLKPVFKEDGKVTAGNACPLNDGAAALVVCSSDFAKARGLKPHARILATAVSGLDPAIMGVGPIEAVGKVLAKANLSISDVGVVELNEAFAAQVLPVCDAIGVDPFSDRLNPHGGAIALGHPFGMTGARIMTTLLNDLETLDRPIGLETMCAAGGQGMACVVERV